MFDIFQEKKADRKYCPPMECLDGDEDIRNLVDWSRIGTAGDMNSHGSATTVIGYWKPEDGRRYPTFSRYFTIGTKEKDPAFLQDCGSYSLVLLGGNDQASCRGLIRVEGTVKEILREEDAAIHEKRIRGEIMRDLSIPIDSELRIYEASFLGRAVRRRKAS